MRLSGIALFTIGVTTVLTVILFMTTTPYERTSYYHYGIGFLHYKMKKYDDASNRFEKSYTAWQDNLMALYFKSYSRMMWGESLLHQDPGLYRSVRAEATELIQKGEAVNHKNLYLFYYVKAWAHFDLHESESADKYIKAAWNAKPDDYDVLILAGRVATARREFRAAFSLFDEAAGRRTYRAYRAYFYRAEAHELSGDYDKAWYYYDKCLNDWPDKKLKTESIRKKTEIMSKSPSAR